MSQDCLACHGLYALAWFSFGFLHSFLADTPGRRLMRGLFGAGERLAYNGIATVHLLAVLIFGQLLLGNREAFASPAWFVMLQWGLLAVGLILGIVALRRYDLSLFSGFKQLRAGGTEQREPLVTDGLHRYMRHPLYTAVLLCLWGLAQDPLGLATACWGTLYILIGTYHEERKLSAQYGADYDSYRRNVPAFLPWRGRAA